jgi:penicillin-binding protein 1C
LPAAPGGALFANNASKLPPPLQRFRRGSFSSNFAGGVTDGSAESPPRILFPPDGARLELGPRADGAIDPLALKISGGTAPLTVLINGVPLNDASTKRTIFFTPDGPGFARLTVMDAKGLADSVTVRLE